MGAARIRIATDRSKSSWVSTRFIIVLLLFFNPPSVARALEAGDAYLGVFGGYQRDLFSPHEDLTYSGISTSAYQPTLNWGDYHLRLIGFYRQNREDEVDVGRFTTGVQDVWFSDVTNLDAFIGDGDMQFVTPSLIFEHLGLPGQSIRGGGARLQSSWGGVGIQAGKLTEYDFLIPEAVSTIDESMAGGYVQLNPCGQTRVAASIDYFTLNDEDRFLGTLYGSVPFKSWEFRLAGWHDSLSDSQAFVAGVRRYDEQRYIELGLLRVPEDFQYVSRIAVLPRGQNFVFGTYRLSRLKYGYYFEGRGGQTERTEERSLLITGSTGGYYRIRLRDTLSGSAQAFYRDGESGETMTRFREVGQYNHRQRDWDATARIEAHQTFSRPAEGSVFGEETLWSWIGDFLANYRVGSWETGGRLTFEHTDAEEGDDRTSAVFTAEGRTTLGYGMYASAFIQGGVAWLPNGRSEVYGGGLEMSTPLLSGWQLRLRFRARRNDLKTGNEIASSEGFRDSNTTIDLFAIVERSYYWGKPESVIGTFTGPDPQGVGLIEGRVFVDSNGNGVFDEGDHPLSGVLVRLDEGFVVETNSQGYYRLSNVAAGDHHLGIDEVSFPIDYSNPAAGGTGIKLYPRDDRKIDWPLRPKCTKIL